MAVEYTPLEIEVITLLGYSSDPVKLTDAQAARAQPLVDRINALDARIDELMGSAIAIKIDHDLELDPSRGYDIFLSERMRLLQLLATAVNVPVQLSGVGGGGSLVNFSPL